MITETMPLNEWPVINLKHLQLDLQAAREYWLRIGSPIGETDQMLCVVTQAIKDQDFEQSKLS